MRFEHVISAFYGQPWAILPEKLAEIEAVLWHRISTGQGIEPEARVSGGSSADDPYQLVGSAAIVPVRGTITPRPTVFSRFSGGASAQGVAYGVQQAADDPKADAIVLAVDSPGGTAYGIPEAGDAIFNARQRKPVYAVADHMAASAAYWLATQAGTVAVSPSGMVGSVGTLIQHVDQSKLEEKLGIKTTIIKAGANKAELHPSVPLSDGARAELQRIVDQYNGMFLSAVARGRSVTTEHIESNFGQGRMRLASESIGLRMADRVATLQQIVSEINSASTNRMRRRVSADLAAKGLAIK